MSLEPIDFHQSPGGTSIGALAWCRLDGRPVAVAAVRGNALRLIDLNDGGQRAEYGVAPRGVSITAVACTRLGGLATAVVGAEDGAVRLIDLTIGEQSAAMRTGHSGPVTGVACVEWAGRPVAVSGSPDGTLRVWNLEGTSQVGRPRTGHESRIVSIACVETDDQPMVVSAGTDGVLRSWDLRTGERLTEWRAVRSDQMIVAVARGGPANHAVLGTSGGALWRWDLTRQSWFQVGDVAMTEVTRLGSTTRAIAGVSFDARAAVATAGPSGFSIWDLASGERLAGPMDGQLGEVRALTTCRSPDDHVLAVMLSQAGTVRIQDLVGQRAVELGGRAGRESFVRAAAVACVEVPAGPLVVTGGVAGDVRTWDATNGAEIGTALLGHSGSVTAIACFCRDDQAIAITSGVDATLRIWDLRGRTALATIALPEPVQLLDVTAAGNIVAAMNWEIITFSTDAHAPTNVSLNSDS
jgi:WD40 repeat protein